MIEVTLELEKGMSDEEIAVKMQEELPGISYETTFKRGKKLIILEINELLTV